MEGQNFDSVRFQLGIDSIDNYSILKVENSFVKNCFVTEGWLSAQLIPSFMSLYSGGGSFIYYHKLFFSISFFITQDSRNFPVGSLRAGERDVWMHTPQTRAWVW